MIKKLLIACVMAILGIATTNAADIYVRGAMNGWGSSAEWKLTQSSEDANLYILANKSVSQGQEFKIADDSWGTHNYGSGGNVPFDTEVQLYSGGGNCKFTEGANDVTFEFNLSTRKLKVINNGNVAPPVEPVYCLWGNLADAGSNWSATDLTDENGVWSVSNVDCAALAQFGIKKVNPNDGSQMDWIAADGTSQINETGTYNTKVNGTNFKIMAAGKYSFKFNPTTNKLDVVKESGDEPPVVLDPNYIYFENTNNWSTVYCYLWTEGTSDKNANWPGVELTETVVNENNGKTYYRVDAQDFKNVIFSGNGAQTADLTVVVNNVYTPAGDTGIKFEDLSGDDPNPEPVYIYFENASNWSAVYCYMFNGGANNGWPGVEVTDTVEGGDGKTYYRVDAGTYPNVIFNNGGNGAQTADLTVVANHVYTPQGDTGVLFEDLQPEIEADIYLYYYQNTNNWEKVYAYAWDSTTIPATELLGGYPGTETVNLGNGLYVIASAVKLPSMQFNNGLSGDEERKTSDIISPANGSCVSGFGDKVEAPNTEEVLTALAVPTVEGDVTVADGKIEGKVASDAEGFTVTFAFPIEGMKVQYTFTPDEVVVPTNDMEYAPARVEAMEGEATAENPSVNIPVGSGKLTAKAVLADGVESAAVEYTYAVEKETTGVDTVVVEAAEAVYYNLQGVRVANPANGVFIRVAAGKAVKVVL